MTREQLPSSASVLTKVGGSIHDDMCKQLVVPHQGVEVRLKWGGRWEVSKGKGRDWRPRLSTSLGEFIPILRK